MFKRQRTGSVVCPGCGYLVGVNDERCYNCGRVNPSLWGFAPAIRSLGHDLGFIYVIMGGTIALYVLTLLASGSGGMGTGITTLLSPSAPALVAFGASGAFPVFGLGHWWTVVTASWLHAGLLHIFFNLLWVRQLAPETADLYGPGRTVIIYTVSGVVGFAMSSIMGLLLAGIPIIGGGYLTVGASAPILGLLGAHVSYSHHTGSRLAGAVAWQYAIVLFLFGLMMPGVDNWAHAGGFAGGYLAGRVLAPSKPEGVDHLVGAIVCLALTAIALAASVVSGWPLLVGG